MNNKLLIHFFIFIIILITPISVFSAGVVFKTIPNLIEGDKTTIIEVVIDPQEKNLNVVDGAIDFRGSVSSDLIVDVETGGSVLTIWPTVPKYIGYERMIRFVGGTPNGFNKEGMLFRMRIYSGKSGDVEISWKAGTAYLNDGRGTQESINSKSIIINLNAQDLSKINPLSQDNTPPVFDTKDIGRDINTYEGKYFITFHATDDISGVSRYEVKEGKTITNVTDGMYIFKDQKRNTPVTITAYDMAGNSKTIEITPRFNYFRNVTLLLVIVLLVTIIYVYKKNNKK